LWKFNLKKKTYLSPGFLVLRLYTLPNLKPCRTAVPITTS